MEMRPDHTGDDADTRPPPDDPAQSTEASPYWEEVLDIEKAKAEGRVFLTSAEAWDQLRLYSPSDLYALYKTLEVEVDHAQRRLDDFEEDSAVWHQLPDRWRKDAERRWRRSWCEYQNLLGQADACNGILRYRLDMGLAPGDEVPPLEEVGKKNRVFRDTFREIIHHIGVVLKKDSPTSCTELYRLVDIRRGLKPTGRATEMYLRNNLQDRARCEMPSDVSEWPELLSRCNPPM